MTLIPDYLDNCLRVIPEWIADRIRRASDRRSLRRFACDLARATLSHYNINDRHAYEALRLAEQAEASSNPIAEIDAAIALIIKQYELTQDREAELCQAFEHDKRVQVEYDRAYDIAAAYRTLFTSLKPDPVHAAVDTAYDASYSLGRLSDDEFRAIMEPLVASVM
jgi:hypothetical protein